MSAQLGGHDHTRGSAYANWGPLALARGPLAFWGPYGASFRETAGERRLSTHEVLLLNSDFEPLNVCHLRRAMALILLGKAEVIHIQEYAIATSRGELAAPSIVKMRYHVRRPLPQLRLSRHSVLARDSFTCQYCGLRNRELTLDHVVPRWMGGPHTWDNLVACCRRCNLKKGDKTPHQAKMKLARPPKRPHFIPYISLPAYLRARSREDWVFYLPEFKEIGGAVA